MHEPDRILDAEGRPLDGESATPPDLDGANPETADKVPGEGTDAPPAGRRRRLRPELLLNGQRAIKLAVVLSFVILLVTMIVQRFRSPKADAGKIAAAKPDKPPVAKNASPAAPKPVPLAIAPAPPVLPADPVTRPATDPVALAESSPPPPELPPDPTTEASPIPQPSSELLAPAAELAAAAGPEGSPPVAATPSPVPKFDPPPASAQPTQAANPTRSPNPAVYEASPVLPAQDLIALTPTPATKEPASAPAAAAPELPADAPEPEAPQAAAPPDRDTRPAAASAAMAAGFAEPIVAKSGGDWIPLPGTKARRDRETPPARAVLSDTDPADSPPAPESPRTRASTAPAVRHVVQPGESYGTIARDFYSSPRLAKALQAANDGRPATPGTTIAVPMVEALDPEAIPPVASRLDGADGSGADPAPPEGRASRPRRVAPLLAVGKKADEPIPLDGEPARRPVHVVRSGETLRSIARDTLRDPHREAEILDLNRPKIADGGRLPEGLRLALPYDAETGRRLR